MCGQVLLTFLGMFFPGFPFLCLLGLFGAGSFVDEKVILWVFQFAFLLFENQLDL